MALADLYTAMFDQLYAQLVITSGTLPFALRIPNYHVEVIKDFAEHRQISKVSMKISIPTPTPKVYIAEYMRSNTRVSIRLLVDGVSSGQQGEGWSLEFASRNSQQIVRCDVTRLQDLINL